MSVTMATDDYFLEFSNGCSILVYKIQNNVNKQPKCRDILFHVTHEKETLN